MKNKLKNMLFPKIDKIFRETDSSQVLRTNNIQHIPEFENRRGGKLSYAEWAHVIGIFQTLFYLILPKKTGNNVLDVGCGTGLLGIAAKALVAEGGNYTGLDVMSKDISYCKKQFAFPNYNFIHFDIANPSYAQTQSQELVPWPIESNSKDLVTALSVWTHLSETDSKFYFKEISRALKKGGKAVVTFFYLDQAYQDSLPIRENALGRFHATNQQRWIFDHKAYDSEEWFMPKWAIHPEDAIGLTPAGMKSMLADTDLQQTAYYPGSWKEQPGVYFQDVLVFEKV